MVASDEDARVALERLCRDRREDYAGLSRLLGRNPAYVQQYIRRGTPRRLDERDRRTLARYFRVAEEVLGGEEQRPGEQLVRVPRLAVGASAGRGALPGVGAEAEAAAIGFNARTMRAIGAGKAADLSIITVEGDSMAPTLGPGDSIMVDRGDAAERLRDGVYVLRKDDALMVKRLSPSPTGGRVSVRSDNPGYPSWPDCSLVELGIVGRVIWMGRRVV